LIRRRNPGTGPFVHGRVRSSLSPPPRLRASAAGVLLIAASIAGCSKSTAPTANPPATTRTVTVTVQDSTGAAVAGAIVSAFGVDNSNGGLATAPVPTDTAGVRSFSLPDGHWIVFAKSGPAGGPFRVAGSSGLVGAKPAGNPDTTMFRLVVLTQSIARGTITLSGRASHDGTLVGVVGILSAFTVTGADGSYELDGLPPGIWTALASHDGFQPAQFSVVVAGPAQTIPLSPLVLAPNSLARP
jgi:hypothetical protein